VNTVLTVALVGLATNTTSKVFDLRQGMSRVVYVRTVPIVVEDTMTSA